MQAKVNLMVLIRVCYYVSVVTRRAEVDDQELRLYQDDVCQKTLPLTHFLKPDETFKASNVGVYQHRAMFHANSDYLNIDWSEPWTREDSVFRTGQYLRTLNGQILSKRELDRYKKVTS